jgi:glycosyltransferase involved in cell wall biosynthesis
MPPRVSVLVSTYNSPAWLSLCLWGYAGQTYRDFEVVVADDGSGFETGLAIQRLRRQTRLRIRHVWQEHQGFGKCSILNKAILAASADYLIFADGDCIPRCDFVEQHVCLAEPGHYLSGGAVRLPMTVSHAITPEHVLDRRATDPKWLSAQGLTPGRGRWVLAAGGRLAWLWDQITTTRATFNGGNSSAWKSDLLRVNGCDERMGYGGEDRELGDRLGNLGLRGKQIRHRAVCVHLEHERGYVDSAVLERNLARRREVLRTGATWTPHGIHKGFFSFEDYQGSAFASARVARSRTAA